MLEAKLTFARWRIQADRRQRERLESLIRERATLLATAPEGSSGELRYAADRAELDRLEAEIARARTKGRKTLE